MTKKSDKPLLLSSSSTHSSISCGIASITTAVKKHVKTLAHPFKKTKQALSKCSASSATIIIDDDSTKSSPASANPDDSSEVEVADADPEKELGKCCFCSFLSPLLITSIRTPEENLALANLQFFQARCFCSVPQWPSHTFFPLHHSQVQNEGWWH